MGEVIIEVKYFNSFVLKKIAKVNHKFMTEPPYPGELETRLGGYGNATFRNKWGYQEWSDQTANWFGINYNKYEYPKANFDTRDPGFFGMPLYQSTYSDLHKYPVWANASLRSTPFNPDSTSQKPNMVIPYLDTWAIEESRIKGGYNNTQVDLGVRAYLVNDEQNVTTNRFNAMIYSGVYNSRTNVNETNVFSAGKDITKAAEPAYGSIQKLYAEDTNLTIYQENKISRALIDKDTIYSAEGGTTTLPPGTVMGQITPYAGEYGITKNPESFAFFGYRKYTSDKSRNSILRLSRDGITEISKNGMYDYFRDELRKIKTDPYKYEFTISVDGATSGGIHGSVNSLSISETEIMKLLKPGLNVLRSNGSTTYIRDVIFAGTAGFGFSEVKIFFAQNNFININESEVSLTITGYNKDEVLGGWDEHNDVYTLSLQKKFELGLKENLSQDTDIVPGYYKTLTFDEGVGGWTSFFNFDPTQMFSLKGNFYTTTGDNIYKHYAEGLTRGNYYGTQYDSNITFVFNPSPAMTKNFKTVSYEGSNGWEVSSMYSDSEGVDVITGNTIDDVIKPILSYTEGAYDSSTPPLTGTAAMQQTATQPIFHAGFDRKENRYVANIRSNNPVRPGQVIIENNGENVAGVKAYYTTVTLTTDNSTQVGGPKELFAVGTEYVMSSL